MKRKEDYYVYLPNMKPSELKSIKEAAKVDNRSIRVFCKMAAVKTAEKILQEAKR